MSEDTAAEGGATGGEARFAWTIAAAFLVIALVKAACHEPWRDELSDWGAAGDAPSFGAFAEWARYSSHPIGWSALVYLFRRLGCSFDVLRFGQAFLATFAVWCVARRAPFRRAHRVLFALGLLPFYEWGVLMRPYCLTLAAGVAACALAAARPRRHLTLACVLVVLSQTTAYGLLLAVALWAAFAVEAGLDRPGDRHARGGPIHWTASTALLAASIAAAISFMVPPGDGWNAGPWRFDLDPAHVRETLNAVTDAFLPFRPPSSVSAWDERWVFAPLAFFAATAVVARRRAGLVPWLVAAAGFLTFSHARFLGAARHRGHLFFAFVLALWFAERGGDDDPREAAQLGGRRFFERARAAVVGLLLVAQVPAGLYVAARDLKRPFSVIREVADFLRGARLDRLPLVGDPGWATAPVGALLERPVYVPASGRTTRAVRYDSTLALRSSDADVVAAARRLAARERSDVVVLVDRALPGALAPGPPLRVFPPGIVGDERYWVYLVPAP